jgi:serine/threonine protein kinase/Tfp pilus assembly protein PilF
MALSAGVRIGPYEIVMSLGAGGMGFVYKARDTRLNRFIALKTVSEEQARDSDAIRRFIREAQAASQLNHPNIVTIHESLEENGSFFLVMEYVSGSTLEAVLASRALTIPDAMHFAGQIADGLAAAHLAGIIHRDLKPANVMITDDGRVKLLDFGLARFVEQTLDSHSAETMQTFQGTVLGTAPYMSPEQAQGGALDVRSDIFSLGCVLYEMVSGESAFKRNSWVATLAAILESEPVPPRELRPEISTLLDDLICRCLRKNPRDRFQTVHELRQALAGISLHPSGTSEKPSIAVLPFANLSMDKDNEYFSDGLAEEILNELTKIKDLRVIAKASAFALRGKEHDLRTIGQRLRVETILEGSVRRAGNRIRVTAQLIQVGDESNLWSERYDRELTDVFAIQDDISQEIAGALKLKLAPRESPPTNISAYQCYLKGIYWYQRYTAQSLVLAKESFERALSYDPAFAQAHAGLAVFYYSIGALSIQRMSDVGPLARAAAEKALAIDPGLSEAHSVLGLLAGAVEYDWKAAGLHFQSAMAVEPVPSLVRLRLALYFLLPLGRYNEALVQYRRALETDPLSMMVLFGLSFSLYCDGRYDEAIEQAARAVDLYPDYWLVHFAVGVGQSQKGAIPEAIASLETVLRLAPSFALATGYLAAVYQRSGDAHQAEKLMEELASRRPHSYVSSSAFAIYYAVTRQADLMFESLDAALEEREPFLTRMDAEPYFLPYRRDVRYQRLLKTMRIRESQ